MQTNLAPFIRDTADGKEAEAILRKCTHCGMCTATCPTYQLLYDELDGPRGRIYLIKQVLEGATPSPKTQLHLDRCLTCRSCETTCPTGVRYGRLLEIGRNVVEQRVGRTPTEAGRRRLLRSVVPSRRLFSPLLALGQLMLPLLPQDLQRKVPAAAAPAKAWPTTRHPRTVLLLESCAQASVSPATNVAAARVLDRVGITLAQVSSASCCGAVSLHLSAQEEAFGFMRRNIDAWWPYVEQGVEAIVITASGCGALVKEYAELLRHDAAYADKAKRISEMAKDLGEILAAEDFPAHPASGAKRRVAFHSPCTLQHGQQLHGLVEPLLERAGYELTAVPDGHLCCGSAGTYSILQSALSEQLRDNKLDALQQGTPDVVATANIGCQLHLAGASQVPVKHWIELLDEALGPP